MTNTYNALVVEASLILHMVVMCIMFTKMRHASKNLGIKRGENLEKWLDGKEGKDKRD